MELSKIILDYIKVLTTSQIVYGAIAITFLLIFKKSFRSLFGRIGKIKFPGGGELSTNQGKMLTENNSTGVESDDEDEDTLPTNLNLTTEQMQEIGEVLKSERSKALIWEFRYLNYFLVPKTLHVLFWLEKQEDRITVSLFDSVWIYNIPNINERITIKNVLLSHNLIEQTGELIAVSHKGKEYIKWHAPLSTLSSPEDVT